jgi:FkbM family methyltransferase
MLRRFQRLVAAVVRAVGQGWRLSALAPTPAARLRVLASVVWLALPLVLRPRRLALPLGRYGRLHVADAADLAAVEEVLLEREYDVPGLERAEVIVDLGSHIGTSIAFFHARYPEARIYGFEPDPATFAKLEANVAGLDRVTVQQAAVGDAAGESVLYASPYSLASSLVASDGDRRPMPVRTVTVDALGLDRIDLLKVDVEGAERHVLAGADLDRVGAVVGELHPRLADPYAVLALLGDFDVQVTKASASSWRFAAVRRTR